MLSPTTGLRLHPTIVEPRRDYVAAPTGNGYRALHLILEVETRFGDEGVRMVPCELQLRTMFQDTWAKISHSFVYHAGPETKYHAQQLNNLSGILKFYDEIFGKLGNR
jgi:putative GTP pyrophosphokinase